MGLGYAGLPMAVELARSGYVVCGFDVDETRAEAINHGRSPVSTVSDAQVAELCSAGRLRATNQPAALGCVDVVLIAVPTPLSPDGGPDLRFVEAAGTALGAHLQPGRLVLLQSTCPPGTTANYLRRVLESTSRLVAGVDFHLAFTPERVDPGNSHFSVRNTPKIVGGICAESTRLASIFFDGVVQQVHAVSSAEAAEMTKLVENTFRYVNISFVNEMALLCDRIGLNVWEVIRAAATKPFGFMAHYPGPGVGGDCIPVVPQFLRTTAAAHGLETKFIGCANHVNDHMPRFVVDKLESALLGTGLPLTGARVLAVGVTYKADFADTRESAAIRVLQEALRRGAELSFHDPLVPSLCLDGQTLASVNLDDELVNADAVLLLTPHSIIDYDRVVAEARLVVDTHSGIQPRRAPNVYNVWVPAR